MKKRWAISVSGPRYSHEKPHCGAHFSYRFNPGSVRIGDKKVEVDVPRVVNNQIGQFEKPQSYEDLKQ